MAGPVPGLVEDDPRHKLLLYPRNSYSRKYEWPLEEDLDFYLAVQGLYEVAGNLLQLLPVEQTYDEDEATGETEYSRFLSRHVPTRADGRWLSDRADAVPLRAVALSESDAVGESRTYEAARPFEVNVTMFLDELHPEPDCLSISSYRSVQDYSCHETVQVTSALVAPATAMSLLRATQTAPDTQAFRLPDASDLEFASEVAGFELTGWIEEHGYAEGLDSMDPLASGMHYPPHRPSTVLPALAELTPDADMRIWRDTNEHIVFISRVWDDSDGGTRSYGSAGHQLLIDRPSLSELLQRLNRCLIVEVQFTRYVHSSAHRAGNIGRNDDEQVLHRNPLTKYFLIDLAGGIHGR